MPSSHGLAGPLPTNYLFIDGGCMRQIANEISETFFNNETPTIDWAEVGRGFKKVFYYDCISPKRADESQIDYEKREAEQEKTFNNIRLQYGYHVYEGAMRKRRKRNEQKKVDVKIAVDMLSHTFMKNMDSCTLLANDLDFQPVLEALVQNGMFVTLMYRPRYTSDELQYAADARSPINLEKAYGWFANEFKMRHPIPTRTGEDLHLIEELEVIETTGGAIQLSQRNRKIKGAEKYVAKFGREHFQHSNRDFLAKYMLDKFHVTAKLIEQKNAHQ